MIRREEWDKAISFSAKFPELGKHKDDITRAHAALSNPALYRAIKKDPQALVEKGIAALKQRYLKP